MCFKQGAFLLVVDTCEKLRAKKMLHSLVLAVAVLLLAIVAASENTASLYSWGRTLFTSQQTAALLNVTAERPFREIEAGRAFSLFLDSKNDLYFSGTIHASLIATRAQLFSNHVLHVSAGSNFFVTLGTNGIVVSYTTGIYYAVHTICNATQFKSNGDAVQYQEVMVSGQGGDNFESALLFDTNNNMWFCGKSHAWFQSQSLRNASYTAPIALPIYNVTDIATGYAHVLFLIGGKVYGAGDNSKNPLGPAQGNGYYDALVEVPFLSNAFKIEAGYSHSLAALKDGMINIFFSSIQNAGRVYMWGKLLDKQMTAPTLLYLSGDIVFEAIEMFSKYDSIFILHKNGLLYAMGENDCKQNLNPIHEFVASQLSPVTTPFLYSPTRVILGGYIEFEKLYIAVGEEHTIAYVNEQLYGFGSNSNGRLGTGENVEDYRLNPKKIADISDSTSSRVHNGLEFILMEDGDDFYAVGLNTYAELGLGGTDYSKTFSLITKVWNSTKQVCTGAIFSAVLDEKGNVFHFGTVGFVKNLVFSNHIIL